jgi:hypothetical protein
MKTKGSEIKNSKLRGEWAELRFMTRAAERGLMVSRPWGDSAPYDVMVEHQGRVRLVQIKSTMRRVANTYRCHVPRNRHVATAASAVREAKRATETCGTDTPVRCSHGKMPAANKPRTASPKPPRQAQIDFVAAYIIPEDLWYILPAAIATPLSGHISLSPHRKGHKYEPYQEAWHLLL